MHSSLFIHPFVLFIKLLWKNICIMVATTQKRFFLISLIGTLLRPRDIQHNDIQHNDTHHNSLTSDTQHIWHSALQHSVSCAIMLNVIMLNVIMLNIIMLNVIMLNVIMLNVVAPLGKPKIQSELKKRLKYKPEGL